MILLNHSSTEFWAGDNNILCAEVEFKLKILQTVLKDNRMKNFESKYPDVSR